MSEIFEDVDIEEELKKAEETVEETVEEEVEGEGGKEVEEKTEEKSAEKTEEEKRRTVDFGAFHEERERRKALQAELDEFRGKYSTLEERIKAINEHIVERGVPAYEEDPGAYLRHQLEKTGQTVNELQSEVKQGNERLAEQAARAELANRIVASENAFRQENPDYDAAVGFLREGRAQEYRAMGYADPAQIEQMLMAEAFQLAEQASAQGVSPAQLAYNVARARGYARQEKTDDNVTKLESIEKGQSRTKSLSGAGGEDRPVLDAEALANMSDEEFARAMKDGTWNKVLSGS